MLRLSHRPPVTLTRQAHSKAIVSPSKTTNGPPKWTPLSMRTGLIARKRGMTSMWDDFGVKFPVSILQASAKITVCHHWMLTQTANTARELSSDCECQIHTKRSLGIPRSSIGSFRPNRKEYDEANDWALQSSWSSAQTDCSRVPCHGGCTCAYWDYTVCYSFRPRAICGCYREFVCRVVMTYSLAFPDNLVCYSTELGRVSKVQ